MGAFFKNMRWLFEWKCDWIQLFMGPLHWYTFHICYIMSELDVQFNAWELTFVILGVGFRFRHCWDWKGSPLSEIEEETEAYIRRIS